MKAFLIFLLFSISIITFSQEVLLGQDVKPDTLRPVFGPNLRHFAYGYLGIGVPVPFSGTGNYVMPGVSSTLSFGIRYKRRLSNTFALGLDLGMNFSGFRIKQDAGKTVPDKEINRKEKFQVNTSVGSAYFRINAGRRGNYMGNYLDLGAFGGWNMAKKHKTVNDNTNGEKVKVITGKLSYIENFSYGVLGRIGINRYTITARYRLSDIFTPSYSIPELPRLTIGVEVGLLKE